MPTIKVFRGNITSVNGCSDIRKLRWQTCAGCVIIARLSTCVCGGWKRSCLSWMRSCGPCRHEAFRGNEKCGFLQSRHPRHVSEKHYSAATGMVWLSRFVAGLSRPCCTVLLCVQPLRPKRWPLRPKNGNSFQ